VVGWSVGGSGRPVAASHEEIETLPNDSIAIGDKGRYSDQRRNRRGRGFLNSYSTFMVVSLRSSM